MKRLILSLVLGAASCATTSNTPARIPAVSDATAAGPDTTVLVCERDTMVGSNIMEVHCRRQFDMEVAHRNALELLQRPMGLVPGPTTRDGAGPTR